MYDQLLGSILRRQASMFAPDLNEHAGEIEQRSRGSRILIIGAAGSIGAAFVRQMAEYSPIALHAVDLAENNLVELVRDLRSSVEALPEDFRALPLALGSQELEAFLSYQPPYDFVLNFAAVKHVRSEKDPYSLMHMVNTNVIGLRDLLDSLEPHSRVFSVSSDKAVNPENAMGASKALMESLLVAYADRFHVSSARFANVAFSDGSLLHSFGRRIEKGQPIVAPVDVRRYFISHEEAGQLCLLAAFLSENRQVFVPRLVPSVNLLTFSDIAELFLHSLGFRPFLCSTEAEARARAYGMDIPEGTWPCYFFESDTTGEKMVEEFVSAAETVDWDRFQAVGVVDLTSSGDAVLEAIAELEAIRSGDVWTKELILEVMRRAVPEMRHFETGKNLDERM